MFAAGKAASGAEPTDAQFNYVTMLLHGNGTNGAQNNTFLDSSTNNFTITRNGNTTQGTFTPYGANWSNYFDGSGDYLTTPSNAALNLSTGDWTIELWVYLTTTYDSYYGGHLIGGADENTGGGGWSICLRSGHIVLLGNSNSQGDYNVNFQLNTWNHIALVRSGTGANSVSLYFNGVPYTATGNGANNPTFGNSNGPIYVGEHPSYSATAVTGYISNARVVKGTAVYPINQSSITVPTTPLTAITNTSLLTCQSNRFIDNSSNAFSLTVTGNTSVQRFSPFSPTTAYSTSVIGGSGYFDGSGDYLNLTTNSSLGLGTGTYTAECWVYASAAPAYSVFFEVDVSGLQFGVNASANIAIAQQNVAFTVSSSTPVPLNAWSHIAVSRDGSNVTRIYLNGVQIASATDTTNYATGTTAYINNNTGNSNKITGYIADLRVLKGTALYTSAFTPPTAPLTAITNTSLLLSYTNAGILDNAMMNDLETVGNAQISTSVKKYGSGSISMTSSGDYLKGTQPSVVYDINGGDFTIEFWVNFTSLAADRALVSKYGNAAENAGGLGYVVQWVQSSSVLRLVLGVGGGSDALYTWSWSPSTSTWYHVAITRSGTSGRAFVNGTQIGTTSTLSTSDVASPNVIQIGKTHTVAQYLLGYMDDLRITKGVARYTANFTAPTAAFPNN